MMDKNRTISECQNGCHRYNKSMDEIVQALAKHRDAAISMKELNNQQKTKLANYREHYYSMQNQIDQLEQDLDLERDFTGTLCREKEKLKEELKISNEELNERTEEVEIVRNLNRKEEKNTASDKENMEKKFEIASNVIKELKVKIEALEEKSKQQKDKVQISKPEEKEDSFLKQLVKQSEEISVLLNDKEDLDKELKKHKDELDLKDALIAEMKLITDCKDKPPKSDSCASLAEELALANDLFEREHLAKELKTLKTKIASFEKNKEEKRIQIGKMEEMSKKRIQELSKLKASLEKFKPMKTTRCSFGWKCRRGLMCKFDHAYLYSKTNKVNREPFKNMANSIQSDVLCEKCGQTCSSSDVFENHMKSNHELKAIKQNIGLQHKQYQCKDCENLFVTDADLKKHEQIKHHMKKNNNIANSECDICHKIFRKNKSLKKHMRNVHQAKQEELKETTSNNCDNAYDEVLEKVTKHCQEKEELDSHARNNHGEIIAEVAEEPKELGHVEAIEASIKNKINEKQCQDFKCEICKLNFNATEKLEAHINNTHAEDLRCDLCRIDFGNIRDMDHHMDQNHGGRWKLNDPDILREGDVESSTDLSYDSNLESD